MNLVEGMDACACEIRKVKRGPAYISLKDEAFTTRTDRTHSTVS
jgi:hypothetical protein